MILETLPEVQALSEKEKSLLAQELMDELHAPCTTPEQDEAILEVLEQRMAAYERGEMKAISWSDLKAKLQKETGASWQK